MNRTHRRWQKGDGSAGGRGRLSQDLSAVLIAQRWKGSHQERLTDLHGNKTDPPCHRRGGRKAEPWLSQLQASAAPRQSPHSSCITHRLKSPFQTGFGFFPGYFSCTRARFWGAPEDYRRQSHAACALAARAACRSLSYRGVETNPRL